MTGSTNPQLLLQLRQRDHADLCQSSTPRFRRPKLLITFSNRLKVAGYEGAKPLFTIGAVAMIAPALAAEFPRNINNICFNALTIGCALGERTIDAEIGLRGDRRPRGSRKVERAARLSPITPATDERPNIPLPKREETSPGCASLHLQLCSSSCTRHGVGMGFEPVPATRGRAKLIADANDRYEPVLDQFQLSGACSSRQCVALDFDAKFAEAAPAVTLKQTASFNSCRRAGEGHAAHPGRRCERIVSCTSV